MYLSLENLFDFGSTIAVMALLAVPYGIALRRIGMASLRNLALGLLFGFAATGAMLNPVALETGVIFDLRALPVGLAGGFFGPVGGVAAMAVAVVTRLILGGMGAVCGIVGIVIAGLAGIAWYYLARSMRQAFAFRLLVLSAMISLHLLAIPLLPAELAMKILVELVPLTLMLNLVGTLVVGGLLDRERCSFERERSLDDESMRDPLTGIANRRGFERMVERSATLCDPAPGSALLVIDLDHFKTINDTHGHDVGDLVLTQIGARLGQCLRGSDIVARFGGEEFVAFLPATPLNAAVAVAERLRRAISDEPFEAAGRTISVTVSVGAHWDANLVDCVTGYASADRALYSAKSKGRNCVTFNHRIDQPALAA